MTAAIASTNQEEAALLAGFLTRSYREITISDYYYDFASLHHAMKTGKISLLFYDVKTPRDNDRNFATIARKYNVLVVYVGEHDRICDLFNLVEEILLTKPYSLKKLAEIIPLINVRLHDMSEAMHLLRDAAGHEQPVRVARKPDKFYHINKYERFKHSEIIYFEADEGNTYMHHVKKGINNPKERKSLDKIEIELDNPLFYRISRKHLVHTIHIIDYTYNHDEGWIKVNNGDVLDIPVDNRKAFFNFMLENYPGLVKNC